MELFAGDLNNSGTSPAFALVLKQQGGFLSAPPSQSSSLPLTSSLASRITDFGVDPMPRLNSRIFFFLSCYKHLTDFLGAGWCVINHEVKF